MIRLTILTVDIYFEINTSNKDLRWAILYRIGLKLKLQNIHRECIDEEKESRFTVDKHVNLFLTV